MIIQNSKVLITGGSSGIGKATAQLLKENGAQVLITGRNEEKLQLVAQELGVEYFACNVAIESEVANLFSWVKENWKGLDVLVNNAGIGEGWAEVFDINLDLMREVYETNVFGAANMGKQAAQIFRDQKSGNIINIASTAALKGFKMGSVYASSKFALRGLTQCWQAELRPFNVRVFEVNPSEVTTAFASDERKEREEEAKKLSSFEIAYTIKSCLEMHDKGYIPEVTVHATNPF